MASDADDLMDDLIGRWHRGEGGGLALHEYLGLSWDEYAAWAECRLSDADAASLVLSRRAGVEGASTLKGG